MTVHMLFSGFFLAESDVSAAIPIGGIPDL